MQLVEEELITAIARVSELYSLLFTARQLEDVEKFFLYVNARNTQTATVDEKIRATQTYLKTNCEVMTAITPSSKGKPAVVDEASINQQLTDLRINAEKIGAQITQNVQSSWIVSPCFVFQPKNAE